MPVLDPATLALLFTEARTANTFTDEPVTDDDLRAIVDLVKWPPTAANTNPLRIAFITSPEGRERLVAHMSDSNKAKTLTAPAVAVLAADLDFHEQLSQLMPHRPGMGDRFGSDEGRRERHAMFNASLQAGYFLLAVRAAGFAAGPMGGFKGPAIDAEFFADRAWRSILVVNIGHPGPDAWRERLPRLPYDDMVAHF